MLEAGRAPPLLASPFVDPEGSVLPPVSRTGAARASRVARVARGGLRSCVNHQMNDVRSNSLPEGLISNLYPMA